MVDAVQFAGIDGQHVELLPARVVMSVYACDLLIAGGAGADGNSGNSTGNTTSIAPRLVEAISTVGPVSAAIQATDNFQLY